MQQLQQMTTNETEYVSLSEAAELLGVSKPTVSRWIRDGHLPAQRIGPRTLRIRRGDLRRAERPARRRGRLYDGYVYIQGDGVDQEEVIRELARLRAEMLAERGGVPFSPSLPLIHEDRDKRVARL